MAAETLAGRGFAINAAMVGFYGQSFFHNSYEKPEMMFIFADGLGR